MIKVCIFPFLLFSIISCKNENQIRPVEILYGQDICERCKMIISEKAYSAEYILPDGEARKFDDIGCMINFQNEEEINSDKILAQYVRDYNTGDWIDAATAHFVWSKAIITPMGHGLAAFKDEASARTLARKVDGTEFSNFKELYRSILKHD